MRKLTTIAAMLAVSLVVLPAVASAQPDEEDLPPGLSLEDLSEGLDEFGPPEEEDLPPEDPLPEETPEEVVGPGVAPPSPEGKLPPAASGNTPTSQPKEKAPKEKASRSSGSPAKSGGSGSGTKAKELPKTGGTVGVALLALGAGTLLVGGGLLVRRIVSSVR